MSERVLVLNCGSSSVKYQLVDLRARDALAHGLVERVGEPGGPPDHAAAMARVMAALGASLADEPLAAVGHRVVHGGERFTRPTVVDDEVLERVRALVPLAPLHNPANILGIEVARAALPGVPHIAVFDTAFHVTLPRRAYLYALPYELYERHGVRRYGFHGTSHEYVAQRAAELLGRPLAELDLVTLHLGNGASACAVQRGRSIDTSMGFGPLEGLVMGTRPGDVDATVLLYLQSLGLDAAALAQLLNKESGLKGLCGDNDQRAVDRRYRDGDERAAAAFEVATYRLKKYVGAYLAALGGRADAIVFTAGIGEHDALVRAAALDGLDGFGIAVDPARNEGPDGEARAIHADHSKVAVLVIPTNEERAIATQALACVRAAGGA